MYCLPSLCTETGDKSQLFTSKWQAQYVAGSVIFKFCYELELILQKITREII